MTLIDQIDHIRNQVAVLRHQAAYMRRRPDWFVLLLAGKKIEPSNRVQEIFLAELVDLLATKPNAFTPEAVARGLEAQADDLEAAITFN